MCIMASPVRSVSNTRIFVGTDAARDRQAVVYAMSVALQSRAGKGNAMILPTPVGTASAASVALIDLSDVPGFFDDLDALFVERSRSRSLSLGYGDDDDLEVHKVGKYDVSIVPTVNDVKRLNAAVFDVSVDTEHTLRENYPVGFAFVVAQLRESGDFHPLAYTHPLVGGRLFVPTRHEHGKGGSGDIPKWDHHIFHQSENGLDVVPRDNRNTASSRTLRGMANVLAGTSRRLTASSAALPLAPYFDPTGSITRIKANGPLPNIDLTIGVS